MEVQKNPSMMTMLIPWITFWIAVSVNTEKGSVIALLVASAIPFIMRKHKFVIWDQLSIVAVAILLRLQAGQEQVTYQQISDIWCLGCSGWFHA